MGTIKVEVLRRPTDHNTTAKSSEGDWVCNRLQKRTVNFFDLMDALAYFPEFLLLVKCLRWVVTIGMEAYKLTFSVSGGNEPREEI